MAEKPANSSENQASAPAERPSNVTHFWCSWPSLWLRKPDKPQIKFANRLYSTKDVAEIEFLRDMAKTSNGPFELKELSEADYTKLTSRPEKE